MKKQKGFTLIEVMIVMALMAFIVGGSLSYFRKNDNNIRKVSRQLTVLAKELRTRAKLNNTTYRLAIQLDTGSQQYWAESSDSSIKLLDEKAEKELEELKKRDPEKVKDQGFTLAKEITKKPLEIPKGMFIEQVELSRFREPIKTGTAYIHFFPQGLVESSSIQIGTDIKGNKIIWTLVFNPLTGQADIIEQARGLKDLSR